MFHRKQTPNIDNPLLSVKNGLVPIYIHAYRGFSFPCCNRLTSQFKKDYAMHVRKIDTGKDSHAMKLVVFILNKEDLLDEVLAAYVEAEVPGATILDSEGMGRFLTYEVPLFASFKEFMKGNKPYNKTIFSVVDKEDKVKKLEELIEKVCGSLNEPGTGVLFSVPVDYVRGLRQPEEDS